MREWQKRIETLSNVAMLVCCILFGTFLVKNYLFGSHQPTTGRNPQPASLVGTKLSFPNIDWASHQQSVLLVLQKGCCFCEESMPFYQRLTRQLSNQANTHLVAILPQNEQEGR